MNRSGGCLELTSSERLPGRNDTGYQERLVKMLALSRKKGEALFINNNIEVTVLEVKGDQVKLGIKAPKEIPVYRSEVYEQIQAANKEALTEQTPDNLNKLFSGE